MADRGRDLSKIAALSRQLCYHCAMFSTRQCWATFGCVVSVCVSMSIPCANAQQNEPTVPTGRDAARHVFEEGERAFEAHDYVLAARAFEQAYRAAPHHAPVWNAARSWDRAGEWARAANAYAKYLRLAPADAPDRNAATEALETLGAKLGRIEIHAPGIDIVRVDDALIEERSVYVYSGMHVIEGQTQEGPIRRTENVEVGSIRSVALVDEEKRDAPETPTNPPLVAQTAGSVPPLPGSKVISAPNRGSNWFGPVTIVTGALTVVSAGLLLWSGLDTLAARNEFDALPTAGKLATGKDKQLRTNLLVGSTVTTAVATGVFFSLWKRKESTLQAKMSIVPPVMGLPTQVVVMGSF